MAKCLIFIVLALTAVAFADVPHLLNVQGLLTDSQGEPVADQSHSVTFSIYNSESGGSALWTETRSVVTMDGLFTLYLGQSNPLPASLFDGSELWLGIAVEGDSEMTPRQRLTAVPYVFRAISADTSGFAFSVADDAVGSDQIADGSIQFSDLHRNGAATDQVIKWNGNSWEAADDETGSGDGGGWVDDGNTVRLSGASDKVGVGVTDPQEKLHVSGNIRLEAGGDIAFGDNNNRVYETGGDIVVTSDDDIHLQPDDDIYITRDEGTPWIHFNTAARCLGVDVINPGKKLDVGGDIRIGTGSSLIFGTDKDAKLGFFQGDFTVVSENDLILWPNNDVRIGRKNSVTWANFDNYGHKLGLGVQNPEQRLAVNGSIGIAEGEETKYHINYYQGGLNIAETGVQDRRIHIGDGGNVGIGTANPGAKLGVAGSVKVNDDLEVVGAYKGSISSASGNDGAPFPRPAYDSGWRTINQGEYLTLNHGIGGNSDNYVVQIMGKSTDGWVNNYGIGLHNSNGSNSRGVFWNDLTSTRILVYRGADDLSWKEVRVRIWYIR